MQPLPATAPITDAAAVAASSGGANRPDREPDGTKPGGAPRGPCGWFVLYREVAVEVFADDHRAVQVATPLARTAS